MTNIVGCLLAFLLALLLSNVESVGHKEVKILTAIGWVIIMISFTKYLNN